MMEGRHDQKDRIRRMLSSLPRRDAPPDFEETLRRRLARRRRWRFQLPRPAIALPAAALLLVAVVSSVVYFTRFETRGISPGEGVPQGRGGRSGELPGANQIIVQPPEGQKSADPATGFRLEADGEDRTGAGMETLPKAVPPATILFSPALTDSAMKRSSRLPMSTPFIIDSTVAGGRGEPGDTSAAADSTSPPDTLSPRENSAAPDSAGIPSASGG